MSDRRLSPVFELKRSALDDAGTFTGYASTFGGSPDSYGDVIAAGAFKASLLSHKRAETAPAMLWAHDQQEPIGRWVSMEEDTRGLKVTGKLTLGTARGAEAYALMQDGAVGLSIGYTVKDWSWGEGSAGSYRLLKSVDLFEVSVVAVPANSGARITGVKSFSTIRDFEAAARDAFGLSPRQAKALAVGGYSALMRRDDRGEELAGVARALNAHASELKSLLKGKTR